jgi:hypothetical protein
MNSAGGARKIELRIGYDLSGIKQETSRVAQIIRGLSAEVKNTRLPDLVPKADTSGIKSLRNELSALRNDFVSSGGDARVYGSSLSTVRDRALALASGLDSTSQEYVQLSSVAAQATREIDKNARAMEKAEQEAQNLLRTQQQANRQRLHGPSSSPASSATTAIGGGLTGQLTGFVAAYGATEVARFTTEMVGAGDQIRRTEGALRAYSQNAQRDMESVLRGARGMATEFEATQTAAVLLKNRIATNSTELEKFSRIASVLGSQTGLSPAEYINELNSAFANSSWDRLDQLGLVSSNVRAEVERLKASGMGMQEAFRLAVLKDAETQLRALEAAGYDSASALGAAGVAGRDFYDGVAVGLSETVAGLATNFTNLAEAAGLPAVSFRDLGASISETLAQMAGLDRLDRDIQVLTKVAEGVRQYTSEAQHHAQAADLMAQAEQRVAVALQSLPLDNTAAQVRMVAESFLEVGREAGFTDAQIIKLWESTGGLRSEMSFLYANSVTIPPAMGAIEGSGYGAAEGMYAAAAGVRELKDALDQLNNTRTGNYGRTGAVTPNLPMDSLSFQERRAMEEFGADTGLSGGSPSWFEKTRASVIARANRGITLMDDYNGTYTPPSTGRGGGGGSRGLSEQEKLAREYESIWKTATGNVRSAVTSAFDTSINVTRNQQLMAAGGIYEEQFNESGRQLEDVINRGKDSPFADDFFANYLGLTDEQLKASAAKLQEDIEAFIRPELFNKDAALNKARRSLVGNRNREQLADELTAQLISEGFAAAEVEAAIGQQLGSSVSTASSSVGQDGAVALTKAFAATTQSEILAHRAEFESAGAAILDGMAEGGLRRVNSTVTAWMQAIINAAGEQAAIIALNQIG